MRKTFITTSIIAALLAMPAFADPTAQELLDQKTVTSKYYVDTTKQDKITTDRVLIAGDGTGEDDVYVPAIVTTNAAGTELSGDSIGILSDEALNDADQELFEFDQADNLVPTVAAVVSAIGEVDNEVYTKQSKMTCAGYVTGHEGDLNYCWLYGEVEVACKKPSESCEYTSECCSGICLVNNWGKVCSLAM